MPKLRILRATSISGVECSPNDVVDVSKALAGPLVADGVADPNTDAVAYAESEGAKAQVIADVAVVVETAADHSADAANTAEGAPQRGKK